MRRQLAMADAPGLDHPLLTVGERDERTELHDLIVAEVFAKPRPHVPVRALGVPDEHARVEQRGLLSVAEPLGPLEVQQLLVVVLGESLLSRPERPLAPSVAALDGLRHVDAAELLQRMLDEAVPEDPLPRA